MKNILLVATGSVAVVKFKKTLDLLKEDFNVKVITTEYVKDNFDNYKEMNSEVEETNLGSFPLHIKHAKWADLIVVAPATANSLSKFRAGIADNQVLSTLIAARNPIMFVPAMNTWMYDAISKRGVLSDIATLGHMFVGPATGKLWEGESGLGRMVEPVEIQKTVKNYFGQDKKVILMPYGASRVYIDPIRFISNGSTGKMAKLLSNELRLKGHKVLAIDISTMSNKDFIKLASQTEYDSYISPAAFADFDVDKNNSKIKKGSIDSLELKSNPDVLVELIKLKPNKDYFAFKLDEEKENAINKMKKNNLKGIIWNKISAMGSDTVSGEIITKEDNEEFETISKLELARMITEVI